MPSIHNQQHRASQLVSQLNRESVAATNIYPSRVSQAIIGSHYVYPNYNPRGEGQFIAQSKYQRNDIMSTFVVKAAVKQADHQEYRVFCIDPKTGQPLDVTRRIRHFYVLRAAFILKYPALYVPPLPQK